MQHFDDVKIASELIEMVERDYGQPIAKIPYFERTDEAFCFLVKIIFIDYTLLEATIKIVPSRESASVKLEGIYL